MVYPSSRVFLFLKPETIYGMKYSNESLSLVFYLTNFQLEKADFYIRC